jgi:hypothetical protein
MGLWNVGSISTFVGNYISWNIVGALSGTTLNAIAEQEINYLNTFTNDNIGVTDIDPQYQPSLSNLVLSKVLIACEANDGGINSVSLGELAVSQGADSLGDLAKQLREDAIDRIRELGRYVRFKRVVGV